MNNFKNINQKQINDFEAMHAEELRIRIQKKIQLYKFVGSLLEHFVPMQIEVYTRMFLDEEENSKEQKPNQ